MKKDYLTPTVHTLVLRSRSILTDGSVEIDNEFTIGIGGFEEQIEHTDGNF